MAGVGTVLSKVQTTDGRTDDIVTALGSIQTSISTMQTSLTHLSPLISASNTTLNFLASLSLLPHQTTANNTISTTAGTLSNADRVSINGLVNAVNNLQSNLQNNNFES
jgi:hypothetical protein